MRDDGGGTRGPGAVVDLSAPDRLSWVEAVLPDSSVPAGSPAPEMVVLGRGAPEGRALWALVRFPPGWARPVGGWYSAEEQVVVLEGRLSVSNVDVEAPGWVCFPPCTPRFASAADEGALALARFSEPPRWVRGEPPEAVAGEVRSGSLANPALPSCGAVVLYEGAKTSLWMTGALSPGSPLPVGGALEAVLSRGGRELALGPGASVLLGDATLAPWLVWVVEDAGSS
jgi:hypothetical protein